MHNWLFPLFLLGIFILLHSKKYRPVGIFFECNKWNMDELSEYGMKNTGEHLCLKFHFLFGFPYVKQTD
ncbi:hypothetical protein DWZ06_01305 [Phocaeicola vulgatus]|nr:hypothetical protein DXD65_15460 [Bacteroides sp. 4_1_36]RGQ28180.1 hypothetical protein DWZ06_01305 [Phocaeicola vulgatus]RJV05381.1 hypothetical protein DWZ03_15865 [Bacteroides sp. AF29-11]